MARTALPGFITFTLCCVRFKPQLEIQWLIHRCSNISLFTSRCFRAGYFVILSLRHATTNADNSLRMRAIARPLCGFSCCQTAIFINDVVGTLQFLTHGQPGQEMIQEGYNKVGPSPSTLSPEIAQGPQYKGRICKVPDMARWYITVTGPPTTYSRSEKPSLR